MLTLVTLLILLLLLAGVLLLTRCDITRPSVLFCIVFAVSLLCLFVLAGGKLDLHPSTMLVIIVAALAATVGDFIGYEIAGGHRTMRPNSEHPISSFQINWKFTLAACSFLIFAFMFTLLDVTAAADAAGGQFGNVFRALNAGSIEKSTMSSLLNGMSSALTFCFGLDAAVSVVFHGRIKLGDVAVFVCYLPIVLITGSRIQVLNLVCVVIVEFLLVARFKNGVNAKATAKAIVPLVVTFACALGLFFVSGFITGKSSGFRFTDIVLVYAGAPVYGLDQYLDVYRDVQGTGILSFQPWHQLLASMGFKIGSIDFGYAVGGASSGYYPIFPERGLYGNVYTTLFAWIHDFGELGMLCILLAISGIMSFANAKCAHAVRWHAEAVAMLSLFYIPLLMSSVSGLFGDNISPKRWLIAAAMIVIISFSKKCSDQKAARISVPAASHPSRFHEVKRLNSRKAM